MGSLPRHQPDYQEDVSLGGSLIKLAVGWPSHRPVVRELAVPELAQPQVGNRVHIRTLDVAGATRSARQESCQPGTDSWKM